MMRDILFSIVCILQGVTALAQLKAEDQVGVAAFISNVKAGRKETIASRTYYPLRRKYPLHDIKNKREFLQRYDELFDSKLVDMITKSSPDKDWSQVGWRGIMLHDGQVWLDDDGKLVAVNYESKVEERKRMALIEADRRRLYPGVRQFKEPVCILETSKYRVRIDEMADGAFRYTSWPRAKAMSEKPDLIIEHGEFVPEGSGGDHSYQFKNEGYVYHCRINVMTDDKSPDAVLEIEKGGHTVLSQAARIIR